MEATMSSTYAESATTPIPLPTVWQRVRDTPLVRWQALLLALAAVSLMAYGLSVVVLLQEPWLAANMGDAMRLDAAVNLAAAVLVAAGLLSRLRILVLLGGLLVLWAALQQDSAIAWLPSTLLPWTVSLVAGAMLVAAARLGRPWVALTVGGLVAFGYALAMTRALAAFDFAIAAFATVLAWALLDLAWRAIRGTPLP
jgi:hypothetical protein